MTTVREIICTEIATLSPQMTLAKAIDLFAANQCGGLPVVADGKLVGILSELELFDILFDPELRDSLVSDFMTPHVWTLSEEDSLGHAAHMFALYKVRSLPVLSDGNLIGMVSRRDLLLSALRCDLSSSEVESRFIPFLDEPATDGTNQELFMLDNLV